MGGGRTVHTILAKVKWTGTTPGFFQAWYKKYGKNPKGTALSINGKPDDKGRFTVNLYHGARDEKGRDYAQKILVMRRKGRRGQHDS